jgi:hypothetical protein
VNVFNLDDMKFSPTAALFEGLPRAGVAISVLVVRTPAGQGGGAARASVRGDLRPPRREQPLLVVSVHESGTLQQTFLGQHPA